jgi:hypothetical protein
MEMAQMGLVFKCLKKLSKVKITAYIPRHTIKLNKKASESEIK